MLTLHLNNVCVGYELKFALHLFSIASNWKLNFQN